MAEPPDKQIAALAVTQYGHVTRAQLLDAGLGRRAIQSRLSIGRLIPVYRGVYAVGHMPVGPLGRAFAAVLVCGKGAVLSHGSAATLWGFTTRWEMPFEVTVPTSHRRRAGNPGTKCLARFLEAPGGISRSDLEDRFLEFAGRHGLPEPQTNVPLLGYVVDVLFPVERVIIEVDGWDSHRFKTKFEGDRERDAVMLAAGYATVRVTDERLKQDPEREARRLHKILQARRITLTVLSGKLGRMPATGAPNAERPAS